LTRNIAQYTFGVLVHCRTAPTKEITMFKKLIFVLAVFAASTSAIAAETPQDPYQEPDAECPCQRYGHYCQQG